jgi:hypothetical protein
MKTKTLMRYTSVLILLGGVAAAAQTPADIVKWTASVPKTVGSPPLISATITAHVAAGWHIYAPTQAPGGPTAMTFRIPDGQPFSIVGNPKGSPPLKKRDENFQMQTEAYLGTAKFILSIKKTSGSVTGAVPIDVRFQVCNESLCLPPTTVHLEAVPSAR